MKNLRTARLSVLFAVLLSAGSVLPVNADIADPVPYTAMGIGLLVIVALIIAAICIVIAILVRHFRNRRK